MRLDTIDGRGNPRAPAPVMMALRFVRATLVAAAAVVFAGACSSSEDRSAATTRPPTTFAPQAATTATPSASASAAQGGTATLLVAGDIADCGSNGDEATADLLDANPDGAVATVGDNAYNDGSTSQYADCYDPTWGRHKARTRPAPGNHEYKSAGADPYYAYFGAAAGGPGKGWYSYDLGAWHVVVLNSNCKDVGCDAGGEQDEWLKADLAAHPAACTLAYWHHARFSSGSRHGSQQQVSPLWTTLYNAGADLVLAGHDHDYERLGPLDPTGSIDQARGMRSFVVGTGGKSHSGFNRAITGSEARNGDTFGILKLTLKPTGYDAQFIPQAGFSFTDSSSGSCH